jgi:hypothetical protein
MALEFQIVVDDKGSAKVKKFSKNVKKSGDISEKASKALKVFSGASIAVGGSAVLAGKQLFDMAQNTANVQDKIIKMGREIGVSTEFLSSMQFSAQLAGTSLEHVDKGLSKMSRTAIDAQNGSATAKRSFDNLGISVKNMDGTFKEADQILFEVSDKFKEMPDGVLKSASAQEIFGKSGKQMINLLNQGSEALGDQRAEAEKLGIVFDKEAGEKAEIFNDTLLRLETTFSGMAQGVGTELIPVFTELFDEILVSVDNAGPAIKSFFENSIMFAGWATEEIGDFLLGWSQIIKEVDEALDLTKSFDALEDPEIQAMMDKITKSKEDQAKKELKTKRDADKLEKKLARQKEADTLKRRQNQEKSRKARQKANAQASKDLEKQLENDAKFYENWTTKQTEEDAKRDQAKREEAQATADQIREINVELNLALLSEDAQIESCFIK